MIDEDLALRGGKVTPAASVHSHRAHFRQWNGHSFFFPLNWDTSGTGTELGIRLSPAVYRLHDTPLVFSTNANNIIAVRVFHVQLEQGVAGGLVFAEVTLVSVGVADVGLEVVLPEADELAVVALELLEEDAAVVDALGVLLQVVPVNRREVALVASEED